MFPKFCLRKIRIEYVLIFVSLLTFAVTEICKLRVNDEYKKLDSDFAGLRNEIVSGVTTVTPDKFSSRVALENDLRPYLFFDSNLESSFKAIFDSTTGTSSTVGVDTDRLIVLQDFQNRIHEKQRSISQGFDRLIFFSMVIAAISVALIIFRHGEEKSKLLRVQTASEEQKKFSRNLHDGVAQDLAAARNYIEQNDKKKSEFYLNRAFEEVRYMIDSLHLNLSSPLENLIRESAEAFESNFEIKTSVQIASNLIEKLKPEQQIEILHIMQEALSNIARHAAATEVNIKIVDVADSMIFRIHDNGKGFSEEQLEVQNPQNNKSEKRRKHWGLVSMKERVKLLGGTLEILYEGGTTIAIRIEHSVS